MSGFMNRIEQRMTPFEGVAAGNTALIKLPIGLRYHHLFLFYSGVTLAQMTEIRVIANGKVFQRFSATERDKLNQHKGIAAASGILQIPFDRIGLKLREQEELTAVNTSVPDANGFAINSFTVEIDIAGTATAPVLSMSATQSSPVAGGPGLMLNIRKDSRSIAGAGDLEVSDYQYNVPTAQALNAMHLIASTSSISKVKIERDLRSIWERTGAHNTFVQGNGVRVPVAGYFSVDTCELGYGANGIDLRGVQDFRVIMTCGAAMTVTSITEHLGVLGN